MIEFSQQIPEPMPPPDSYEDAPEPVPPPHNPNGMYWPGHPEYIDGSAGEQKDADDFWKKMVLALLVVLLDVVVWFGILWFIRMVGS